MQNPRVKKITLVLPKMFRGKEKLPLPPYITACKGGSLGSKINFDLMSWNKIRRVLG
ncbi:MAG: hypothetical protein H7A33_02985 [Deltaproteobacteria bacterium]|nr:hypothetical protein [Deltaproteobacteria bacterium]